MIKVYTLRAFPSDESDFVMLVSRDVYVTIGGLVKTAAEAGLDSTSAPRFQVALHELMMHYRDELGATE